MKKAIVCLLFFSLLLFSFKTDRKKMLTRSWRAVKLESPELDSFFRINRAFVDTMGKNDDDATNIELYGTTNVDSLRNILKTQLDSFMDVQMKSVKTTVFNFRKDSVAVLSFDNVVDSGKWYFDKAGKLVITPLNPNDNLFSSLNIRLVALDDNVLKLKFIEDSGYTIVTFNPERK